MYSSRCLLLPNMYSDVDEGKTLASSSSVPVALSALPVLLAGLVETRLKIIPKLAQAGWPVFFVQRKGAVTTASRYVVFC
jgi:hypothetical protein